MNEQKRQAYLKAMDIQAYFPRLVLPSAKPSPKYDFPQLETVEEVVSPAVKVSELNARSQTGSLDAVEELRSRPEKTRKAEKVPEGTDQERGPAPAEATENVASLKFTLRYFPISASLAVLDEVPTESSGQSSKESLQLMQAILRALGQDGSTQDVKAEEFSWPPQLGYAAKGSPESEAKKGLMGFLKMRQETDGFSNLLVFAGQLEQLLLQQDDENRARDRDTGLGYQLTVTHSLTAMLAVPTLKRDVWQHLQALRGRIASSL